MIDYAKIYEEGTRGLTEFISQDRTIMRALMGSTLNNLESERAQGNMITICPHCHRVVQESDLMEVDGIVVCPGLRGQEHCRDGGDLIFDLPYEGEVR